MFGIFRANYHNFAVSFDYLTLVAHRFYRWSYFHFYYPPVDLRKVLALVSVRYSAFVKVVRAHCYLNFISHAYSHGVLAHLSAKISRNNVTVGQLNLKIRSGQNFRNYALDFDYVVL